MKANRRKNLPLEIITVNTKILQAVFIFWTNNEHIFYIVLLYRSRLHGSGDLATEVKLALLTNTQNDSLVELVLPALTMFNSARVENCVLRKMLLSPGDIKLLQLNFRDLMLRDQEAKKWIAILWLLGGAVNPDHWLEQEFLMYSEDVEEYEIRVIHCTSLGAPC